MEKLFQPDGNALKRDYPMLAEVEAFKVLTDKELLFVYYFACKDSPIYGLKKPERVIEAIKNVADFKDDLKDEEYENYVNRSFPPHIAEAVKVMGRYDPETRKKAKVFTQRIMDYMDRATTMDMDMYTEVSDIKSFIDMQINIAKNLPSMVEAFEQGYGFNKANNKSDKKQINILEE